MYLVHNFLLYLFLLYLLYFVIFIMFTFYYIYYFTIFHNKLHFTTFFNFEMIYNKHSFRKYTLIHFTCQFLQNAEEIVPF